MSAAKPLNTVYFPVKNDKLDYVYCLKDIISHTFTNHHIFLQGFISQDTEKLDGSKGSRYFTVCDFPAWLQTDVIESQVNRYLYEVIPNDRPIHPYFDIEYDGGSVNDIEMIDMICHIIIMCFSLIGVKVEYEDFSIFDASGEDNKMPSGWKSSFHIILNTTQVFRNIHEHKLFMDNILIPYITSGDKNNIDDREKLYWIDSNGVQKCIFDSVPYKSNQTFRLPFQSKITSPHRTLKQMTRGIQNYCIGVYCDPSELEFIELPFSNFSIYPQINYSNYLPIPSQSPEFELARELSSLLSKDFLYNYDNAIQLIFCLSSIENSDRMRDLIHSTCSRASNYEWKWVNNTIKSLKFKGFTMKKLREWAEGCTNKDTVSKVIKQYPVNYSYQLFSEMLRPDRYTQINERYLSNSSELTNPFNDSINTLIIKSLLGTGKTHFIKNNILDSGNYNRVLVISPRKSYTNSQKGSLPNFTSYLDSYYGDLSYIDHLIIQVESLHRIGNLFQKYDLVLLDEVESILNQLHSIKTNAENLITNHEVLAMVVSTAGHVIMADAFISDRTFNFCKELRNFNNTYYIENICNPYIRQAIFLRPNDNTKCVANLAGFCEKICDSLRDGKKIVIVWTSKRKGDWFIQNFLNNWNTDNSSKAPSWIFYNSATSKEEQEGLKNVNESWRDVQCLMMTTSITVGISYDPHIAEAEFDEAFLYGSAASAAPRDIAQALFRVRTLKANKLTYVIDSRGAFSSGSRGFANIWNEVMMKENRLIRDHPLVKWTTCPSWARYNFVYCENEERCSRVEYKAILEEYLVRSGYSIVEETYISNEKLCKFCNETENIDSLFWENIEDIDSDMTFEIQKLMKRSEASAEEFLQYTKANFRAQFIVGCSEEDLECWWNKFYTTGSEGRFWNIVKEKRWSVDDIAKVEASKRYAIMSGDSVKERETLEHFLKIIGMSYSQEEITISSEKLEEIGKELSRVDKELRKGLGLRTSERKGEWKTKNTIDLITVILENWGRSCVETIKKDKKINKKSIREYSLQINKDNNIWKNIYISNINYDENLLKI